MAGALKALPLATRVLLFQHLAAMEKAGVPQDRAWALLDLGKAAQARVAEFRRLTARRPEPVGAGVRCGLFNEFEAALLRAAIAAGSPLPTYQRFASHLSTRLTQQKQIRARMVLPLAILTLSLLVQPIPRLFAGTLSTGGYLLRAFGPLLLLAAAGACLPRLAHLLPTHKRANRRDFWESLALLLHAGLPLFEALPLALDTVRDAQVRAQLATILPRVQSGATLTAAVADLGEHQLHALVNTGEHSGTLPEMIERYARMESDAIAHTQNELAAWAPRLFYAAVACSMALSILRGAG